MGNKNQFDKEFALYEFISNIEVREGGSKTLYEALSFNSSFSLLEIYRPHLILYILPQVFESGNMASFFRCGKAFLKTALRKKRVSHLVINYKEAEQAGGRQKIAYVNFSANFYRESLKKIVDTKDDTLQQTADCFFTNERRAEPEVDINLFADRITVYRDEVIRYVRNNHQELVRKFGRVNLRELLLELNYLFTVNFRETLGSYVVWSNQFAGKNISLYVTNDFADPLSRLLLLAAKKAGTKSLLIQQGLTREDYPEWKFCNADFLVLSGSVSESHIKDQIETPVSSFITGIPNYDSVATETGVNKEENKEVKHRRILLTTQPYFPKAFESRFQRLEIFISIIVYSLLFSRSILLIKPHPSEKTAFYRLVSLLFRRVKYVAKSENIYEVIAEADMLITSFSQTSLYSIIHNKPTVNVYFSDNKCPIDFVYAGASVFISSKQQLRSFFKTIDTLPILPKPHAEKLEPWIFLRDGNSVSRIRNTINTILHTL